VHLYFTLIKVHPAITQVFDNAQGIFIGMLDYRDITAHVLMVLHKIPSPPKSMDADWEVSDVVKLSLQKGVGRTFS
jgi:hypothetical protein